MLHPHTAVTLSVHTPRRVQNSGRVEVCVFVCGGVLVFYYMPTTGTVFVKADVKQDRKEESPAVGAAWR